MPQAIQDRFHHLRDGSEMQGLADAARSRSESDWLIGINGTRAITKRMFGSRAGNVASIGRVGNRPSRSFTTASGNSQFQTTHLLACHGDLRSGAGPVRRHLSTTDFKKNNDEHDRADRIWDQRAGRASPPRVGEIRLPMSLKRKSQLANRAAPV